MAGYGKVFFWGLLISALGTLPLGVLNVTAMQVAISDGLKSAFEFSVGVAVVEIAYVRLCLVGMDWLRKNSKLLKWMDWIALTIVIGLAAGSFSAALNPHESESFILRTSLPFFILGLSMSALNPVQIPFWLGWSSVLMSRKVLKPLTAFYSWYIAGIALGTLTGLAVFVFGGKLLVDNLSTNQVTIQYVTGFIFLVTGVIQLIKILKNKGLAARTDTTVDALATSNREPA